MARVSLRAACDQARQWLESNDLERAIGLCEHILRESPGNLEAYRILGEACLANRQLDRAQEAFERVLRSDPESIPAHVGLGITFERRGKLDRAVQEFEQALEIKPDMPELRSQLLRLYSDGGIENAQLRLSRAGLARLYAKGQMLPQAIAELRHVIGEQPNRYDAKVALAEILWRDEQEAAAASLCRKLVGERAELLKAQLLLGYIDLSAGRPSGEQHWRAAAAIDPDLAVARALFDPLPPIVIDPPQINAWDELAWQRQRDELEQIAATRPMQAVVPAPLPPEPQEFIPGASFFASRTAAPSFDPAGSDDFLASLLDLATPSAPAAKPAVAAAPVSVPNEDLGLDADMQPFSLSELGLTEDELAGLNPIVAPPVPPTRSTPADVRPAAVTPVANTATPPPVVRPALQVSPPAPDPVSDDDDLIAFSLNSLDEDAPTPAVSPSSPADEYDDLNDIGAFSLSAPSNSSTDEDDDLNDIDAFSFGALDDQPVPPPAPPTVSAPVQPTRTSQPIPEPDLDDLGLGDMQPFSLADLGLSDEEIAGLESIDTGIDTNRRASAPNQPIAPVDDYSDLPVDLLPFSMDALDQSSSRDSDLGGLPSSLQPFSIDEPSGMQRPRVSGLTPDLGSEAGDDDEENTRSQRGFSWQQPSTKPETNFASSIRQPESPTERTLFNKLKQMRETRPIQPADEPPEVTLSADEHLGLFSLDDVPLNDPTTPAASSLPQISGIARREGTSVFSSPVPQTPLPPLASKPQPPISAVPPTSSVPKPQPPVPVVVPPTPPVTDSSDNIHGTIAAGDLEPFSLEELGLSSEEIAALGLGEAAPPPIRTPEPEPTISEPAPTAQHEHVEINMDLDVQGALAAGEVQPFSFADLGLTDEELAALGL
ncbi:MAG: tetratricopeptide repeat protein, partial [Roseiflexaceae bacterium]|nr:tetratricopeptide repeat protein [Roseiflexaceae bacterium]